MVFVPYRGIPNLNFLMANCDGIDIVFSSPTGAFLISIEQVNFDTGEVLQFSSPTGAFLISISKGIDVSADVNIEFSSPTGAFLISMDDCSWHT